MDNLVVFRYGKLKNRNSVWGSGGAGMQPPGCETD